MIDSFLLVLGGCALGVILYSLTFDKSSRATIISRLRLRVPSEKSPASPESPLSPTYESIFPPHGRAALANLDPGAMKGPGKSAKELSQIAPDYTKCVPDKQISNTAELGRHVTPTGFTVEEIRRLGDFPDYATLSGVPLPAPYHEFDIRTALPRPYRPFRWAYHQTMSLTRMEPDFWLELDKDYKDRIKQRQDLFSQHGRHIIQALPGSELATKELMEMCLQFLVRRYPMHFTLDVEAKLFTNNLLGTTSDLKTTAPLTVLLDNVPEDFAIMLRSPDTGIYSFRAGIICSSLGWSLGSKIGLELADVHAPVPEYRAKMRFSMDRYFAKKPTDRPIQRGSWGFEIDEPLFMPPGDPHERLREEQNPAHTIERARLRVDWQTLRRLPLSGAVVFNFKGLFTPIADFRHEPYVPSLALKVLREGHRGIMEYKNTWHTEHVVIPALEQYERGQIAAGMMPAGWEPHTLDESPFFPGWEEKWHRQQGF